MNRKTSILATLLWGSVSMGAVLDIHDEPNVLYTDNTAPKLHSTITNTSDQPVDIKLVKKRILMPEGWDVTFCFKQCLPPFIDELEVTMDAGESITLDVDYLIDDASTPTGTAVTEMTIFPVDDTTESYVRTYGVVFGEEISDAQLGFSVINSSKIAPIDKLLEHKVSVFNKSNSDQEVTISRIEHQLPENWDLTMCFDLCMPSFLKSGDWIIPANGEKELKVDITPSSEGTAIIQFDIAYKGDEPISSILLSYPTKGAESTGINEAGHQTKSPISLTMQNNNYALSIPTSGHTEVKLFNMKGQQLATLYKGVTTAGSEIQFSTKQFARTTAVVQVVHNGVSHAFPIHTND